ncbi:MAG: tRNA (adenosine(37)-N6)-dimethylallyltransferase MiaA [Candidatus Aminicenantales bacterium]
MPEKDLVIILGPTAVGKSELAIDLAERFAGEIINCDSMQVYRGFDIGTDKPSPEIRQRVSHHLIDIVDPDTQFTAAAFVEHALAAIGQIVRRNHLPLVVGGTGLYLKALTEGLFPGPGRNQEVRQTLEAEIKNHGLSVLYQRLLAVDPEYGKKIHPHDRLRIVRALEVYLLTGKPISEHFKATRTYLGGFNLTKIGLKLDREELKQRIDERVERMFARGLVTETKKLVNQGIPESAPPFQALGYKQALNYLHGKISLHEAKEQTKKETREYAKRQMTWFRRMKNTVWFNPKEREKIVDFLRQTIKEK